MFITLLLPVGLVAGVEAQSSRLACEDLPLCTAESASTSTGNAARAEGSARELSRLAAARLGDPRDRDQDVERALDELEAVLPLVASDAPRGLWSLAARAVEDLAIGATPRQRLALALRGQGLLEFARRTPDVRRFGAALLCALEPLAALDGAAADEPIAHAGQRLFHHLAGTLIRRADDFVPSAVEAALDRAARLRQGAHAPPFIARDDAGNQLRSDELEGRIVVLRFWDAASPASMAAHVADADLVRTFWDAPFELIGASSHDDRDVYLEALGDSGFAGTQLFDGPISTHLADELAKDAHRLSQCDLDPAPAGVCHAWRLPAPGSVFVLDARGVIRGRDLSHDALRSLVQSLVHEENERRRSESIPPSRSSR